MQLLAVAGMLSAPAYAQQVVTDAQIRADAAERAAQEAERAAADAERAMLAARQAAVSARSAADMARAVADGRAVPQNAQTSSDSPSAENLPVTGEAAATAQGSTPTREDQRAFEAGLASSVANGPNQSALKSSPAPDFQLLASSKDKVASLAWTMDISGRPTGHTLSAQQLTFTASGKIDDSGSAQIVGLDGLTNGNELKLTYAGYISSVNLNGLEKDEVARARANCLGLPGSTDKGCDPYAFATGVGSFVAKYNPAGLQPLLREVLPGPVWFYGLGLSGNQASFKYLNRASFKVKNVDHFGFGASLFGGLLLGSGGTAIIGSFDYKRSFKENDPVTLCEPISGSTQSQCLTSPDGAPVRKKRSIAGLELRHAFEAPMGTFASLAIAPKFSVDVGSGDYSLAVPLYFATESSGKLRGGVQGVYSKKKDADGKRKEDFALGLFVGVPFTFFPQ